MEDSDFLLALQLQNEFENNSSHASPSCEVIVAEEYKFESRLQRKSTSVIDETWELTDPNPDARALFLQFNEHFFWGQLSSVEVKWSKRMTSCAGVCCYEGNGGLCSIRLSEPLLKLRPRKDLVETLLHEMIHAYLFVTENDMDHSDHGSSFKRHMNRINKKSGANITIYHDFYDEVDNYKQHWWLCNGPCQKKPPYFGLVKRSMNRAPSPHDFWYNDHNKNCGGTFSKIKEPEGFGEKKKQKKDEKEDASKVNQKGSSLDTLDIPAFLNKNKALGRADQQSQLPSTAVGERNNTMYTIHDNCKAVGASYNKESTSRSDNKNGAPEHRSLSAKSIAGIENKSECAVPPQKSGTQGPLLRNESGSKRKDHRKTQTPTAAPRRGRKKEDIEKKKECFTGVDDPANFHKMSAIDKISGDNLKEDKWSVEQEAIKATESLGYILGNGIENESECSLSLQKSGTHGPHHRNVSGTTQKAPISESQSPIAASADYRRGEGKDHDKNKECFTGLEGPAKLYQMNSAKIRDHLEKDKCSVEQEATNKMAGPGYVLGNGPVGLNWLSVARQHWADKRESTLTTERNINSPNSSQKQPEISDKLVEHSVSRHQQNSPETLVHDDTFYVSSCEEDSWPTPGSFGKNKGITTGVSNKGKRTALTFSSSEEEDLALPFVTKRPKLSQCSIETPSNLNFSTLSMDYIDSDSDILKPIQHKSKDLGRTHVNCTTSSDINLTAGKLPTSDNFNGLKSPSEITKDNSNTPERFFSFESVSSIVKCPVCDCSIIAADINSHLDLCLI